MRVWLKIMVIMAISALTYGKTAYQSLLHSQTNVFTPHDVIAVGETVHFAIHIQIDPEWHVYWQNPGDSGAAPILSLSKPVSGIQQQPLLYPFPQRIFVPPLVTFGYENEVLLLLPMTFAESLVGTELSFTLKMEYLICKVECLPVISEWPFTVTLQENDHGEIKPAWQELWQKWKGAFPVKKVQQAELIERENEIVVVFPESHREILRDFFPLESQAIVYHPITMQKQDRNWQISMKPGLAGLGRELTGLAVFHGEDGKKSSQWIRAQVDSKEDQGPEASIFYFLLLAFIGGVILNFMPCVFPILGIKMLTILQQSQHSLASIRRNVGAMVAGMLTTFFLLGLILAAFRWLGSSIGWGFQLQSHAFVAFLCLLFVALAFNFAGLWDVKISFAYSLPKTQGWLAEYAHGVLAVLVATPCTAPFMGAALGYAISQEAWIIQSIFLSLGVGFASPFILFAIFPQVISLLPKPGKWLLVVKKMMAVPLMLTALWLGWVFWDLQSSAQPGVSSTYWQPFDLEQWEDIKQGDHDPLFLNFTASWCITCQVNEVTTFRDRDVQNFVNKHQVHMIKVDWTKKQEDIAQLIASYGRIGVPVYVFIPEKNAPPILLPEILSPGIFMEELSKHIPTKD